MFLIRARCEGVHAAAVKEGIYARLLRAAQAASQLAPAQGGQAFLQIEPNGFGMMQLPTLRTC